MDSSEVSRWNEAAKLLLDVLKLPPAQQQSAVNQLGEKHGVLRELRLLHEGSSSDSLVDLSLKDVLQRLPDPMPPKHSLKGRQMGRWVLGDELGRGGMSVVYQAHRQGADFEQRAALKVLSVAALGENFVAGFLRERQILSDLQHPGICRLIDGGISNNDEPFLVMQWINGTRIDLWCQLHDSSLAVITRMMMKLCEAVAYAQRHLVVHQDINPSNVLVDEHDQPVLIDFGIAKFLDPAVQSRALRAFTPLYAAPEQLAGGTVTTATDVYALGQLFRTLLQERAVDGELQLILQVATRDAPVERYHDAASLLADLRAWQAKRPLAARPSRLGYRVGRFLARHRLAAVAGVLLTLSVLVGLAATLWQARLAATERDIAKAESQRATQVTEFLKDLFRASDPDRSQGQVVTANSLLEQGAHQVLNTPELEFELRAEMLILLGDLFREVGDPESAESLLRDGLALADEIGEPVLQVGANRALALLLMDAGRHEDALALAEESVRILDSQGAVPGILHASLMQPLLFSLTELGRVSEAVTRGEAVIALVEKSRDLPPRARFDYLYNVANVLLIAEHREQAEALLLRATEIEFDGVVEPSTQMHLHSNLAGVYNRKGDLDAAVAHYRAASQLAEKIYLPNHPVRARMLSNLASGLNSLGRLDEAEQALLTALDIYQQIYGDQAHPRLAAAHNNLGRVYQEAGRYEEAEPHLGIAWDMALKLFGPDDPRFAAATANLGILQLQLGNHERAEQLLVENWERRRSHMGEDHPSTGTAQIMLAALRLEQSRALDALRLCDDALELFDRIGYGSPVARLTALTRRARALADLEREEEARTAFEAALELAEQAGVDSGLAWPDLLYAYAEYLVSRRSPQAAEAVDHALRVHLEMLGEDHPQTLRVEEWSRSAMSGLRISSQP